MFFISKWGSFSKETDWYDHLIPNAASLSPMPRILSTVSFLICPIAGPMCNALANNNLPHETLETKTNAAKKCDFSQILNNIA